MEDHRNYLGVKIINIKVSYYSNFGVSLEDVSN